MVQREAVHTPDEVVEQPVETFSSLGDQNNRTDAGMMKEESNREKRKFILALVLFGIFGVVLLVAIFRMKEPDGIVSIAGIFSAWIGAIIAFYYVEHQSSERVEEVRKSRNQLMREFRHEQALRQRVEGEMRDMADKFKAEIERTYYGLIQQLDKEKAKRRILEGEVLARESVGEGTDVSLGEVEIST